MALRVAYPPMSPLPPQHTMKPFTAPGGAFPTFSCGFDPCLLPVKTEPQPLPDSVPPPSFLHPPYTPVSSANFPHLEHSATVDMYESSEGGEFNSWAYKHPEHWEAKEVLDWVFSLTNDEDFDGALFQGEAYNTLTGRQLCNMSVADFLALDQHYGARVHDIFNWLVQDTSFQQPLPPDSFLSESWHGGQPGYDFLHRPQDLNPPQRPPSLSPPPSMSVFVNQQGQEMTVSLDGLGLYDIDVDFSSLPSKHPFPPAMDDSDYHSGSEGGKEGRPQSQSSDGMDLAYPEEEEEEKEEEMYDVVGSAHRKPHTGSTSSESGYEGDTEGDGRKTSARKRQSSPSKGNHLWEFIRDLLKSPVFNPSPVRWEDKDQGVFRFVQSEAVAQLWGRKKNNPQMTYEKLSRAMRFCRSAGYFENVPKTGRFPKKLCFKFGHKAHGWQD